MQNIFLIKRKEIIIISFIAALLLALLLTVSRWVLIHGNGFADAEIAARPVYLSTTAVKSETQPMKTFATVTEIIPEMNNEPLKNSKFCIFTPSTEQFCGLDSTKVDVLFPDGSVKVLELEDYVLCCVLGEMPLDFEPQALMAQSVAVRSFTVRRMLFGTSKHRNADVCTDFNCCQCYKMPNTVKLTDESYNKLKNAVSMTRGVVALYDGQPIEAAYHASSGECTLDSEDVWGGRVEYLRSVKSPKGETDIYENGYGHRVGMSQHGANLLAKEGMGYVEILKYYYSGISLGFI